MLGPRRQRANVRMSQTDEPLLLCREHVPWRSG